MLGSQTFGCSVCFGESDPSLCCGWDSQTVDILCSGLSDLWIFFVQDCQTVRYSVFRTVRLLDILCSGLSDR